MTRLSTHATVSAALSQLSDHDLSELLDQAEPGGTGIGGPTAVLDVAGTRVFVKRVPLTDLELRNAGSTANVFDLPMHTHYGVGLIGSPGFGAWRELAVHTMTTDWVLGGEHEGFPLTYHWRVLPHPGWTLPDELDCAVEYWGPEMAPRIEALRASASSIALFLECFPQNLHDWLNDQDDLESACEWVEQGVADGVEFMNSQGLLHFDGHFQNVLTDGECLYFADYGLAISSYFDLSQEETAFFTENQDYDRHYTATHLSTWFPHRHNEVAVVMKDFYRRFQHESRRTPYPFRSVR